MTVFASCFVYSAIKHAGPNWPAVKKKELDYPDGSYWPGIRTLGQMRELHEPVAVWLDGTALIGKTRSRAAEVFLRGHPEADVWVTVDDDMFATGETLCALVAAVRETRGVVGVPYVHRDGHSVTWETPKDWHKAPRAELASGATLLPLEGGMGLGLVAIHRHALDRTKELVPTVRERRADGELRYPALFREEIAGEDWYGEDYSFMRLCHRAAVPVHLLCDAPSQHAGRWCMLRADGFLYVGDEDLRAKMTAANAQTREREEEPPP